MRLEVDPHGRLVIVAENGARHVGVVPVRAFPLSAPEEFIGLLDGRGREIACIATMGELDDASRSALETTLKGHEFMPIVHEVLDASPGAPPTTFRARTDRGEITFVVTSEEHIRNLDRDSLLITDSLGIRYRVPDARKLSRQSRKLLGLHV
jgi:hypothetical protein